uniref:Nucleolar protein 56 n=1 Tax=Hirondellea gigas TaxID=1518452 RepID=A0A6A7G9Q3_9CRUS
MTLYLLFESAAGFALLEHVGSEEVAMGLSEVEKSITSLPRFSKMVHLKAFLPFTTAENALDNMTSISEGLLTDFLKIFLEANLPKVKKIKKATFKLGVDDHKIGSAIQEVLNYPCVSNDLIRELLRGVRLHFQSFIKALKSGDIERAELGLSHRYSQHKVKFNINREDNMVIQSICLLDQLDKDLNTFAMRVREWYSWHFPELSQMIKDNYVFARLTKVIGVKETLSEDKLDELSEITLDEDMSREILEASRSSMGTEISEIDIVQINSFAVRVISLAEYRKQLHEYLITKMTSCAPNLSAVIGEIVGARLISHAGSLTNLAKYPASTVQILGAEKALFRALKTKGNTPKYGLIFHSSFISRAGPKNKGRISRYLANKCSIASRIDSFSDSPNAIYGLKLHEQVEDRLKFYESGEAPKKNIDVMREAHAEILLKYGKKEEHPPIAEEKTSSKKKKDKSKKKKRRHSEIDQTEVANDAMDSDQSKSSSSEVDEPKVKKSKKEKKDKSKKKAKSEKKPKKDKSEKKLKKAKSEKKHKKDKSEKKPKKDKSEKKKHKKDKSSKKSKN